MLGDERFTSQDLVYMVRQGFGSYLFVFLDFGHLWINWLGSFVLFLFLGVLPSIPSLPPSSKYTQKRKAVIKGILLVINLEKLKILLVILCEHV